MEIRLHTEVTADYVEKEGADALIIAVGSEPLVPPIPGLTGENVIVVNDYYKRPEEVEDTVAVMGGGLAGCEIAIHLARLGKQVELIEMPGVSQPSRMRFIRVITQRSISNFYAVLWGCRTK